MENSEYYHEEVLTDAGIPLCEYEKNTRKPLMRQCMICIGLWNIYFMQGLYLGAPTVLIAQVRREANSTDAVSDEMSSWIPSMQLLSSMPVTLIVPWLFYYVGRKYTYCIAFLFSFIGFVIFYTSANLYHILISQVFVSFTTGTINTFMPVMIVEYTSTKYRGVFLTFKSASTFWGIWVSNAIGTYFHWKNIAKVSFVCSVYMITVLAWPESPTWLAMKGRYAESAKSHRWLKGVNVTSENELAKLIMFYKKSGKLPNSNNNDVANTSCFHTTWSTVTSRQFYKPTLLCITLFVQYQFTGKYVISIYALEVLKTLTQNDSVAYKAMLILDGVTVFSMYLGCVTSRYFKRLTLMLFFSIIGISSLCAMSLYVYLVSLSMIKESHVLIILLLAAFSIATGCGPMILASSIYGEIVPLRYQTPITILNGFCSSINGSCLLKISPFLFRTLKMHGTFLFFAISSSIIMTFLYIYLPETKNKTVQEIEQYFSDTPHTAEQSQTLLHEKRTK